MRELHSTELSMISGGLFAEPFAAVGALSGGVGGAVLAVLNSQTTFGIVLLFYKYESPPLVEYDPALEALGFEVVRVSALVGAIVGAGAGGALFYKMGSMLDWTPRDT